MGKGLIVDNDGALVLFNRGFRNFILTAIGKKEVDRIKEQLKDNGRWGNLKAPLNLAILAILIFLFASQQDAYSTGNYVYNRLLVPVSRPFPEDIFDVWGQQRSKNGLILSGSKPII